MQNNEHTSYPNRTGLEIYLTEFCFTCSQRLRNLVKMLFPWLISAIRSTDLKRTLLHQPMHPKLRWYFRGQQDNLVLFMPNWMPLMAFPLWNLPRDFQSAVTSHLAQSQVIYLFGKLEIWSLLTPQPPPPPSPPQVLFSRLTELLTIL